MFAAGRDELKFITIEEARERRMEPSKVTAERPDRVGVHVMRDIPLDIVAQYIDWSPLFWTWELKGSYPSIFDNATFGEQAKEIYTEAKRLLARIIEEKRFRLEAVFGLFPAHSEGDDVVAFEADGSGGELERFCFLRQQRDREGLPNLCLSDFVSPRRDTGPDFIGAFAVVCHGVEEFAKSFENEHDDYQSIMVKALGDRFAEALAEFMHKEVRAVFGYGKGETLSIEELIREEYRGIRPAPGYPACPDHTEKGKIWKVLDVEENIGLKLTESYAMTPASSVSGFYFAHPDAKYFNVGKIDKDQVFDYAKRKGMSIEEAERWLAPNLGY